MRNQPSPSFSRFLNDFHRPHPPRQFCDRQRTSRQARCRSADRSFFEGQAAIAAFEGPDGRWDVTVHFAERAGSGLVRELVAIAAGDDIAKTHRLRHGRGQGLGQGEPRRSRPGPAGRFVVHGQHDRERVAPNKLGIEIEAALAFGTGHHGTTRGCLLLLDHVLKA